MTGGRGRFSFIHLHVSSRKSEVELPSLWQFDFIITYT